MMKTPADQIGAAGMSDHVTTPMEMDDVRSGVDQTTTPEMGNMEEMPAKPGDTNRGEVEGETGPEDAASDGAQGGTSSPQETCFDWGEVNEWALDSITVSLARKYKTSAQKREKSALSWEQRGRVRGTEP